MKEEDVIDNHSFFVPQANLFLTNMGRKRICRDNDYSHKTPNQNLALVWHIYCAF